MNRLLIFAITIQIIFFSCRTDKSLSGKYVNGKTSIELRDNKRYIYNSQYESSVITSQGFYTIKGNIIQLNSDYKDSVSQMQIIEEFDPKISGIEIVMDSNYRDNYSVCTLVINEKREASYKCFGDENELLRIQITDLNNVGPQSLQFFFANGYHTRIYTIKNPKANRFKVSFNMPKMVSQFATFSNEELNITNEGIRMKNMKLIKLKE